MKKNFYKKYPVPKYPCRCQIVDIKDSGTLESIGRKILLGEYGTAKRVGSNVWITLDKGGVIPSIEVVWVKLTF